MHPDAPKLTSKTVNKLFGGVQTIARWAFKNGMVPDDVQWSDPFATMRLDEDAPARASFTVPELNKLFASPFPYLVERRRKFATPDIAPQKSCNFARLGTWLRLKSRGIFVTDMHAVVLA